MTADVRRIGITAGNLKNNTLYVAGLGDFFPKDAVGGPRRKKRPKTGTGSESSRCLSPFSDGHGFELTLDGLNKTIVTDIGSEPKTGKARHFLRCRSDIGKFFKRHEVKAAGQCRIAAAGGTEVPALK